jgi:fucose permease
MFYPLGGLLGILYAERLTARFGTRALTAIGFSLAAASMAALGPALAAGSTVLAGLLLVLMGLPMAMADFIGNFEGTQVDRLASRSLFPAIHSAYGVGMLLGAYGASALIARNVNLAANYAGVAVVVAVGSLWAASVFPSQKQQAAQPRTAEQKRLARVVWGERRTQKIALIGFTFIMAEMAAGTWMPLALTQSGFSASAAAAALGVFWIVVTAGRMVGGTLVDRFGRMRTIQMSIVLSIAGISVFMLANVIALPYLGLALWGFGIAAGFPMSVNSMGDNPVMAPYRINMIITMVYLSSMTVGPALGAVGQSFGIYVAFGIPLVLLVISGLLSSATDIDATA